MRPHASSSSRRLARRLCAQHDLGIVGAFCSSSSSRWAGGQSGRRRRCCRYVGSVILLVSGHESRPPAYRPPRKSKGYAMPLRHAFNARAARRAGGCRYQTATISADISDMQNRRRGRRGQPVPGAAARAIRGGILEGSGHVGLTRRKVSARPADQGSRRPIGPSARAARRTATSWVTWLRPRAPRDRRKAVATRHQRTLARPACLAPKAGRLRSDPSGIGHAGWQHARFGRARRDRLSRSDS